MRGHVLTTIGLVLGLQLATPEVAWGDDGPILVNESTDVTLTQADDGTATATATIQNPSSNTVNVWAELGAIRDADCRLSSPSRDQFEQVDPHRSKKITITFMAACDPERKDGTDFTVHTDGNTTTFAMHAKPPAAADPDWTVILAAYLIAGALSLILMGAAYKAWDCPEGNDDNAPPKTRTAGPGEAPNHGKHVTMTLPGLAATWKFTDSWAANATVVTAVFTGIFGAKDIVTDLLGDSGKPLLTTTAVAAALAVGLAGVSPMVLQALRRRVKSRAPMKGRVDGKEVSFAEVSAGLYVTPLGLLVAGALTLTATSGQLAVILTELATINFWPGEASIILGAVAAVLLVAYAVTATQQNLTEGASRGIEKPKPPLDEETDEEVKAAADAALRRAERVQNLIPDDVRVVVVPSPSPAPAPVITDVRPPSLPAGIL